jgi:hypothetical protein
MKAIKKTVDVPLHDTLEMCLSLVRFSCSTWLQFIALILCFNQ